MRHYLAWDPDVKTGRTDRSKSRQQPEQHDMNDALKLYTFGGLSIQQAETTITGFVSRKVDALFIYLACNSGDHPRELLAEMLWDDLPQDRAMGNLRTALSSLQRRLAPYLSITRQTVGLNAETDIWLDVQTLETELDRVEEQSRLPGNLSRSAANILEQALTLFKGEFLAGFNLRDSRGFEGWQTLERERLRGRIIEARHCLVDHYLETHQYGAGLAQAMQLLQLDTLWEETHRQLMFLYAQSGQLRAALAQYETCRALLEEELGVTPEPATQAVYRRIQAREIVVTLETRTPPHNLPVPGTPFIDRPNEVSYVSDALNDPHCRLVTIVGTGGSGKTRLSLQVAALQLPQFINGVFQINLAPVQTSDFIISTIIETLKIGVNSHNNGESELLKYLSTRQLLLILDNFEHLLDGVNVVLRLLAYAPDLKILITSRERLNVQEEWVVTLGGMAYPAAFASDLAQYSAVQLFVQTASRVSSEFSLADNAEPVFRICQLVQGMPLALELAASWLRVMTCSQIANEITHNLDILQSPLRNVPERHRSIRAVFEVSWALLTAAERQLLQRLSVFQGSFQQSAAQQITGASALTLLSLQDKSLLNAAGGYFELHQLLRQYSAERLNLEVDEALHIKTVHSMYYLDRLIAYEPRLFSEHLSQTTQDLAREIEDIRAAWTFAIMQQDLPLARQFLMPLYSYFDVQCRYYEGEELFDWAYRQLIGAETDQSELLAAQLHILQGSMFVCMSRYSEAQTIIQQSLPILQQADFPWETRIGLASLGTIAYACGNYLEARAFYEQALVYYEQAQDTAEIFNLLIRLSDISTVLGDYQKAHQMLIEKLPMLDQLKGKRGRLSFLTTLGDLEHKLGNFSSAKQRFTESLTVSEAMQDNTSLGVAFVSLGRTAYALGDYEESIRLCGQSIAFCTETRNQWGLSFALAHRGRAYHAQGQYQTALQEFRSALDICQEMGNRWVMSFTLRQLSRTCLALGIHLEAAYHAFQSLEIASAIKAQPLILDALINIATLLYELNRVEEAFQIALFVSRHPISEYETRHDAERLVADLQSHPTINAQPDRFPQATIDSMTDYALALRTAV